MPAGRMGPAGPFFFAGCLMRVRIVVITLLLVLLGVIGWFALFEGIARVLEIYLRFMNYTPSKVHFYAKLLREGSEVTLKLTIASGVTGLVLGLVAGISKLSKNPLFRQPATFYVWVMRGTPLMVQILFAATGFPILISPLWEQLRPLGAPPLHEIYTEFVAAYLALSFNVGAYNAEVIRAGVQAIPKGQWEAAQSLGLTQAQVMRYVVVPQAIRIVIPPLINNLVALLKDSSLAYTIGLLELVGAGQRIISFTFRPNPIYVAEAAIYLLLTSVLTIFTNWVERRLRAKN